MLKSVCHLPPYCLKTLLIRTQKEESSSLFSNTAFPPTLLMSFKKWKLKTWHRISFLWQSLLLLSCFRQQMFPLSRWINQEPQNVCTGLLRRNISRQKKLYFHWKVVVLLEVHKHRWFLCRLLPQSLLLLKLTSRKSREGRSLNTYIMHINKNKQQESPFFLIPHGNRR